MGRKGPRWTLEDLLVRLEREGCCRFVSAAHQSMGAPSWRKNLELDLQGSYHLARRLEEWIST